MTKSNSNAKSASMKKSATHISGSRKPLRVAIAGAAPMARHHARLINALDVWLYPFLLVPLSALALVIQKVMRPKAPALNVAKMFARLRYDTARIASVAPAVKAESEHASLAEEERLFGAGAASQPEVRVSSPVRQTA